MSGMTIHKRTDINALTQGINYFLAHKIGFKPLLGLEPMAPIRSQLLASHANHSATETYMYMYVCVCMYVCMYVCMCTYICVYVCMYVCVCICVCVNICVCLYVYVCMC